MLTGAKPMITIKLKRSFAVLSLILSISCSSTKEKKETVTNVSGLDSKIEFLNSIQRSFNKFDISEYRNLSFTKYDMRFVEGYQKKLKKIQGELKTEDYDYFITQINEYENLERSNIEVDFKLIGFNYITDESLKNLGKTYDELWTNFRKKYGTKSLLSLSKPLLSKDAQLALIEIQAISETENHSNKELFAFKKINDQWIFLSEL